MSTDTLVHASLFNIVEPKRIIDCGFSTTQAIQRQLEEVAEKQRDLEERGVAIEKTIRREAGAGKPSSHITVLQLANVESCIVCYSTLKHQCLRFYDFNYIFFILLPDTFSFRSSFFPLSQICQKLGTLRRPSSIRPGSNLSWRRTDWPVMSLNSWSCE